MGKNKLSKEKLRLMALELEQFESGYISNDYESSNFIDRKKIWVHKDKREMIFQLKADDQSITDIASKVGVSVTEVEVVLERDQAKIKHNPKWVDCLKMYKEGETLADIGDKYGLTRERVRQICNKQLEVELGYGPAEAKYRKREISTIYRSIVEGSREDRVEDVVEEKFKAALSKGLEPQYFDSVQKFSVASGLSIENLKKFKPEVYQQLVKNQRRRRQKWSTYYDACRTCGTKEIKHHGYGYCENCYSRSPEVKSIMKRSFLRNREARRASSKKYFEDYYSRPEVQERIDREYDIKNFGGNRKKALIRDGYKCLGCGMTLDVKNASGKPKVRVWHLNNRDDNSLDSLGTYCQSCLFKTGNGGKWRDLNGDRS